MRLKCPSMFHTVRSCKRLHQGFTLIELLVVIAIVAVLVSILLPAIQSAKYKAQLAICMTRVRNLALAGNQYALDHFDESPNPAWYEKMPEGKYLPEGASGSLHYSLYCPIEVQSTHYNSMRPGWVYTINIDLASVGAWGAVQTDGRDVPPSKLEDVVDPARCMFFSDGGWRGSTFPHIGDYRQQQLFGREDAAQADPPHPNYSERSDAGNPTTRGFHVAFLDGHVETTFWQGEGNAIDAALNPNYTFNRSSYWMNNTTFSGRRAPFDY